MCPGYTAATVSRGTEDLAGEFPMIPFKLAKMLQCAEYLAQRAAAEQAAATAAQHYRMMDDSQTWKSILDTWRLVVAAMPNHPELEQPFVFMQQYMSIGPRGGVVPPAPPSPPFARRSAATLDGLENGQGGA